MVALALSWGQHLSWPEPRVNSLWNWEAIAGQPRGWGPSAATNEGCALCAGRTVAKDVKAGFEKRVLAPPPGQRAGSLAWS